VTSPTPTKIDLRTLVAQARGGRVVRSSFVDASDIDRRALAADGVRFAVHGGFPDPARVVYTLYPEHIPSIDDPVRVLRLTGDWERGTRSDDILVALALPKELVGDVRLDERSGDALIALLPKAMKQLDGLDSLNVGGRPYDVALTILAASDLERSERLRAVVVPSLRVDVVGAKGFGVSRSYFQAGIEGKKVRINGQIASSSSDIRAGDTLSAEGLGRIEFKRVMNETKRGNIKIELEIHR
jgi:RNA-binding protein YlmH